MRPHLCRDADAQIVFDVSPILPKKHPLDKYLSKRVPVLREAASEALLAAVMMRLSADDLHGAHRLGQHLHLVLQFHALGAF